MCIYIYIYIHIHTYTYIIIYDRVLVVDGVRSLALRGGGVPRGKRLPGTFRGPEGQARAGVGVGAPGMGACWKSRERPQHDY